MHIRNKNNRMGFPGGAVVESPPADAGDVGSCPGPGRSHMPQSGWVREPWPRGLRVRSLCSATGEDATVRSPRTAKNKTTTTKSYIKSYNILCAIEYGDHGGEHRRNQMRRQEIPDDEAPSQRPLVFIVCMYIVMINSTRYVGNVFTLRWVL